MYILLNGLAFKPVIIDSNIKKGKQNPSSAKNEKKSVQRAKNERFQRRSNI